MEKLKENIDLFSTEKLCRIIASSRYLGSFVEEAVFCMEELARRRQNGEQFNYEEFIESEFKKIPEVKLDIKSQLGMDFNFLSR